MGVTRPGGMAQYVSVPEKSVFAIGDLPFEQAAFMEPLSCVLHGLERLDPPSAARVAILGAGPIGMLLMQAVRLRAAAEVTLVERNPDRAAFAKTMGADHVLTDLDGLERDAFDAVIDATGSVAVMARTPISPATAGRSCSSACPPLARR